MVAVIVEAVDTDPSYEDECEDATVAAVYQQFFLRSVLANSNIIIFYMLLS